MGKLKNFKGFSDKFKEILNLTQIQVSQIEETEYNFHKDHHWNKTPENKQGIRAYLNEILKYLTNEQLEIYNTIVEDQKVKKEKRRKEKIDKALEIQSIRLKALNLTTDQLETYVKRKLNFNELRRQKMKQVQKQEEMDLNFLQEKVYEEEIFPIFDSKQLKKYKELKKNEELNREVEEKKWRTKHEKEMFKHRYNIDLTKEQAKELFAKDFNIPLKDSRGDYFSDFEMKEKERFWYEKHLSKEQFQVYLPFHNDQIKRIVASIKKSNDEHDKIQLQRTKSYFEYYLENVLPYVTEARKRIEAKLTLTQKNQIKEIRQYYFTQQELNREKYIKQHNRHYKDFKPNALSEFQLRQKLERINFNIYYLYGYEPSKKLMNIKLQSIVIEENKKLKNIYSKLKEFQILNYESTGGTYGAGWVIKIPIKAGEEHLDKIGILLLSPKLQINLELIEMR